MSVLGSRVRRTEDPRFLTAGGTYVADLTDPRLSDVADVTFVRSTMAHARVESVDVSGATSAPGVLGVFTAADLVDDEGIGSPPISPPLFPDTMRRPWLATDTVRFVGEPIAIVVSERAELGVDAAESIWVELEPLPVVVDPFEALEETTLLHPAAGTNVAFEWTDGPFDDSLFDGCDLVVSQRIVNQRLAACPLEGRAAAAAWEGGRLTVWISSQNVHSARDEYAAVYGLDADAVHVIAPDVGGGFGPKISPYNEELLLAWLAREVGRPVRWVESRSENLMAMGHGRAHVHDVTIGGRSDGSIEALRVDIVADTGAYPGLGGFLPYFTRRMAVGTYAIPKAETRARCVMTNTMSTVAYRGAGRPEATATIERALDLFAAEAGLDPVEIRRRNLIPSDAFPYHTPTGATYDSGDFERALDLVVEAAGYATLRAEQSRRRKGGDVRQLGIGISTYVEITAGPSAGKEFAEVRVHVDGSATVLTGTSPHGQGHHTSWAMIASDELGIPMDRIEVIHGDTDLVPSGGGTMASRSLQLGGSAVQGAAAAVVDRARALAAEQLEAAVDDVVFDRDAGAFHVAGTPAVQIGWTDIVAATGAAGVLGETFDFRAPAPTYPFGAHLALVEVDIETGEVRLVRHVTCDDAGRILNPVVVEGQRHGGIAQGVAQALLEEFRYDDDGNPITANLADYSMISAAELPSFELVDLETPTPANPLGAKGIGESGTIGATPAVQNAVVDALSPWGIRHLDMPLTPESIWRALTAAGDMGEP